MTVRERRIGLISDTHGLLRTEAIEALRGSELIIHAGDIGKADVLERLSGIAPVIAVKGNNDSGSWAAALNDIETVEVADAIICVIHDLAQFDVDPLAAGYHAVVSGHSHRPAVREQEGVLYVNPGSAGPRRFSLPVSVGHLIVAGDSVRARLVTLTI
jgi:putative phosphoesterase